MSFDGNFEGATAKSLPLCKTVLQSCLPQAACKIESLDEALAKAGPPSFKELRRGAQSHEPPAVGEIGRESLEAVGNDNPR